MASCGRHTGQFYWGSCEHPSREKLSDEIRYGFKITFNKGEKTHILISDTSDGSEISGMCHIQPSSVKSLSVMLGRYTLMPLWLVG